MKMKVPDDSFCSFRLKPEVKAWLKARAIEEGHCNRSVTLRMILAKEMKKEKGRR